MAMSDAMWRGETSRTLRDHERWLKDHDQDFDEVRKDIGQMQVDAAAHRARVTLFSGIGGAVGAGLVTVIVDLVLKALGG